MEYRYELISNQPLGLPERIELQGDFAQIAGKLLSTGQELGYANDYMSELKSVDDEMKDIVMSDLKSVTVWFTPRSDYELKPNASVIIDSKRGSAFAEMLRTSTMIDTDTIRKKIRGYDAGDCRAQIFSQPGTTDIRTAAVLASFYCAVESADWTALEANLLPDVTCTVSKDIWVNGLNTTKTSAEFINGTKKFRAPYGDSFSIDITWAYIETTRAMVEFCIWSNGVMAHSALTQYSFEIIDGVPMFSSIYNHTIGLNDDVVAAKDGTLQWTVLD